MKTSFKVTKNIIRVLNELADSRSARTSKRVANDLALFGYIRAPWHHDGEMLCAELTNKGEAEIGVN